MKTMRIMCMVFVTVMCSGCIDIDGEGNIGLIDKISVYPDQQPDKIALCMDGDVYVTDFKGEEFKEITDTSGNCGAVFWSGDGILCTRRQKDLWLLNLYQRKKDPDILLQEMTVIRVPVVSAELSYMVMPDEMTTIGNLNIFEKDTQSVYIVMEDAYYDYEWLPGTRKIAAVHVAAEHEDNFQGVLLIKDIDNFSEEIIYNGIFVSRWDYVDIRGGKEVIFSSEGKIYIYNTETKNLTLWGGPKGYDFRLPPSVNSSLRGYILAKVKGIEEEWGGQLYLIPPNGEFISLPGWPLWINEKMIVCLDLENFDIIVENRTNNEIINLTERFAAEREK